MNVVQQGRMNTRKLVIAGMLSAISIFLGVTRLGFIAIPPINATILHVPVIIGSIIEGPIIGGVIGLVFGLFSMYNAFTAPTPTSFLFWNPIIALLPRILIGIVSYYVYKAMLKGVNKNIKITVILASAIISVLLFFTTSALAHNTVLALVVSILLFSTLTFIMLKFKHKNKEEALSIATAAVIGTLTNTIGVLGLAYLIYLERYATALGLTTDAAGTVLLGISVTNGIPEAFISALITIPVVIGVKRVFKNRY